MSVPQQTLDAFIKTAKEQLCNEVHYWKRGTVYDVEVHKNLFSSVDAFIVLLPNNAFKHEINSLPSGTKSELIKFIGFKEGWQHGEKHLFTGYIPVTTKQPTIYSASYSINGLIEGVHGSARNFNEYCINYKNRTAEEAYDDLIDTYDQQKEVRRGRSVNKVSSRSKAVTKIEDQQYPQTPLESYKMIMLDLTDKRVLLLRGH